MLQTKTLAFEPQFYCEICGEAVTNPLCPSCLSIEVDAWSTLYPNLRKQLLPKIKKYLMAIEDRITDSTDCIKCKNKRASICAYCFTDYVLGELKKISSNEIILKEFLEFFDFKNQVPNPHAEKWGYDS